MQNTQPKFKWHNEVIAWLNGETIEWRRQGDTQWNETTLVGVEDGLPCFFISYEYRIKPKEVVKYAGIWDNGSNNAELSEFEYDSLEEARVWTKLNGGCPGKFQKRTYLNGELIALELVKV